MVKTRHNKRKMKRKHNKTKKRIQPNNNKIKNKNKNKNMKGGIPIFQKVDPRYPGFEVAINTMLSTPNAKLSLISAKSFSGILYSLSIPEGSDTPFYTIIPVTKPDGTVTCEQRDVYSVVIKYVMTNDTTILFSPKYDSIVRHGSNDDDDDDDGVLVTQKRTETLADITTETKIQYDISKLTSTNTGLSITPGIIGTIFFTKDKGIEHLNFIERTFNLSDPQITKPGLVYIINNLQKTTQSTIGLACIIMEHIPSKYISIGNLFEAKYFFEELDRTVTTQFFVTMPKFEIYQSGPMIIKIYNFLYNIIKTSSLFYKQICIKSLAIIIFLASNKYIDNDGHQYNWLCKMPNIDNAINNCMIKFLDSNTKKIQEELIRGRMFNSLKPLLMIFLNNNDIMEYIDRRFTISDVDVIKIDFGGIKTSEQFDQIKEEYRRNFNSIFTRSAHNLVSVASSLLPTFVSSSVYNQLPNEITIDTDLAVLDMNMIEQIKPDSSVNDSEQLKYLQKVTDVVFRIDACYHTMNNYSGDKNLPKAVWILEGILGKKFDKTTSWVYQDSQIPMPMLVKIREELRQMTTNRISTCSNDNPYSGLSFTHAEETGNLPGNSRLFIDYSSRIPGGGGGGN